MSNDKMWEDVFLLRKYAYEFCLTHDIETHQMMLDAQKRILDGAAQFAERIALLEQQNEQLQAQVASACEFYQSIINANYRTWDCGLDNADEFVRWIKSRAVHAMSTSATQTSEAYKRRIQAEALENAASYFDSLTSIPGFERIRESYVITLRRMAAGLKGE